MICDMNRAFIAALWRLGLLAVVSLASWTAQAQIQAQTPTQILSRLCAARLNIIKALM